MSLSSVQDSTTSQLPDDCVLEVPVTDSPTGSPTISNEDPPYTGDLPNFIVIQPDDLEFFQRWDPPPHVRDGFGGTAFPASGLPNIDSLRSNGLTMTQAYTASAMCGTSRYSTMTGRYPSRSSAGRKANTNLVVGEVTIPTTKLQDETSVMDGEDCTKYNIAALLKDSDKYKTG